MVPNLDLLRVGRGLSLKALQTRSEFVALVFDVLYFALSSNIVVASTLYAYLMHRLSAFIHVTLDGRVYRNLDIVTRGSLKKAASRGKAGVLCAWHLHCVQVSVWPLRTDRLTDTVPHGYRRNSSVLLAPCEGVLCNTRSIQVVRLIARPLIQGRPIAPCVSGGFSCVYTSP